MSCTVAPPSVFPRVAPVFAGHFGVGKPRQAGRASFRCTKLQACPFKGTLEASSIDDLPFKPFPPSKPYKLLLGLRKPQYDWLDVEEDDGILLDQLRQRAKHIEERRDAVIQLVDDPRAREASWELLQQLLQELPASFPRHFQVEGPVITHLLTGERYDTSLPGVDPLEVAGRILQEDFCLLAADPAAAASSGAGAGSYRLLGGVVCFPAHWSIREKLGLGLAEVHEPVPRWGSDAAAPAHAFLTRLTPQQPFVRWNWAVSPTAELHLSRFYKPPPAAVAAAPANGGTAPATSTSATPGADCMHLRLERQYFHRLPRSGCLVFTIRTYLQPLRQAVRGRPLVAASLAGALRDLPYETLRYKGNLQRRLPAVLELLEEEAAAAAGAGGAGGAEGAVVQGDMDKGVAVL
ncbi:hypothetical protein Agub_g3985 [Astrephomene gubernaculifera]|uniref:DUF3445 domain-containing protein n=1 Tax=Astrephomene gubernaculifera TaxID=47775 RepID=A0AAD3DJH7_9CHLO|nr:hypothetical protein Agub_g3985 [Astrephomene gubernaculifera]